MSGRESAGSQHPGNQHIRSVAEALTQVSEKYGLELPLAPLLKKDLVDNLEAHGEASYLGIHDAEGEPCHHLLFRGDKNDLQAWISTGEQVVAGQTGDW